MEIHDLVQEYADRLGVSRDAQRKWRERGGIPPKWQLEIIRMSEGKVTANDFMAAREATT